jgi:hypothetical protein
VGSFVAALIDCGSFFVSSFFGAVVDSLGSFTSLTPAALTVEGLLSVSGGLLLLLLTLIPTPLDSGGVVIATEATEFFC